MHQSKIIQIGGVGMLIITRSAVDDDAVAITVASAAVGGDGVAEQKCVI